MKTVFSLLFGAGLTFAAGGIAAAETVHPVSYYVSHDAERKHLIATCLSGAALTTADLNCINAQQADWTVQGRETFHRVETDPDLSDRAYWDRNPIARTATLAECKRGGSGPIGPSAGECAAARMSKALSK